MIGDLLPRRLGALVQGAESISKRGRLDPQIPRYTPAVTQRIAADKAGAVPPQEGRTMGMDISANPLGKRRIGRMLVDEGIIEPAHLKTALEVQAEGGGKIVETLIHLGYLDASTMSSFLTSQPGVASIELDKYLVPRELCELIPREYALEHEVFPIDRSENCFTAATAFPIDLDAIRRLEEITGLNLNALLCNAQDIRAAIRRYYPEKDPAESQSWDEITRGQIETGLKVENVVQMLRRIDSLPALPQTVQQVQEATADPDTSLRDIAEIVSTDPAISAKLLRLANSAAYGFLSKIDNVHSAITLLGMRETYMAVLSSAIIDLTEASRHFDHERYWKWSMFCAAAARNVATAAGHGRKAGVFTAGLLADIGRFALSEIAPIRYSKIDQDLEGNELAMAEEEVLGIGHPEAGHILAVHWRMPEEISEPIRFHHRPELARINPDLTAMVALAAIMSDAYMRGDAPGEEMFESHSEPLSMLGLQPAQAADAYAATRTPEMEMM